NILMSPVRCLYPSGALSPGNCSSCPADVRSHAWDFTLYRVAPALRSIHGRGISATPLVFGNAAPGPRSDARRGLARTAMRPRAGSETGRQRLYCLAERVVTEA